MRAVLGICLTGALAIAGCGGSSAPGKGDAERVVREFVAAVSARDGTRICTRLVTTAYLRETTGTSGTAAVRACEQQIRALDPRDAKLVLQAIHTTTVEGGRASVVADVRSGRATQRTTFRLRRQGDGFRLESGTGG